MLLETKIRASDHSIISRVCAIDSEKIESKKNVSSDSNDKKLWAELIKKVETLKDTSAFEELFNHFAPRVKAFLMKSGADSQMAEECSQEVMATVWRKAHLFDPSRASASTWIFTIARNKKSMQLENKTDQSQNSFIPIKIMNRIKSQSWNFNRRLSDLLSLGRIARKTKSVSRKGIPWRTIT